MTSEEKLDQQKGIIRALWCVDSTSGQECLVDLYTSKIIAKRKDGKIIDPSEEA